MLGKSKVFSGLTLSVNQYELRYALAKPLQQRIATRSRLSHSLFNCSGLRLKMTLSRPPKLKPDKQYSWMRRVTAVLLLSSLQTSYVAIAQASTLFNQADYSYTDARNIFQSGSSSEVMVTTGELVDPIGQILGCNGDLLPNYDGFSVEIGRASCRERV